MNTPILQEDYISTKDFLIKVIKGIKKLWSYWQFLCIGMVLGSLTTLISDLANKREEVYGAKMVFNLEIGGQGSDMGGLSGLTSSLGLGGSTQQSGDIFSGMNFVELITSRIVFERALLKEVEINGNNMIFVNYYKDSSDISRNEWGGGFFGSKNQDKIAFKFKKKKPEELTPEENIILDDIYKKLKKETSINSLTGTSFTEVVITNTNEMLAKRWAETLLDTFEEFYIDMKTKKTKEILLMQEARLSKIEAQMFSTDRRLAQISAENQNVVDPSGTVIQEQIRRNNGFYSQQYLSQLATVDNIRTTLINQTPIFTIIEPIRLPLLSIKSIVGSRMPIGGFVGLVISILLISIYITLKEVLAQIY
ncbi:MAG: hypothetical protein ACK4UP_11465 [Spirosomataceae bacterium]